MACIRRMNKLINRKSRDRYRNISLEELTRKSEPTVEMKEEVQQDYEQCDKIVESLNLTDNMRIALECRMAGLSYPEIGRILPISNTSRRVDSADTSLRVRKCP